MHHEMLIHYSRYRRTMHWISAPVVLMLLYTGFYFGNRLPGLGVSNYRLHLTLGVVILILTLCRLMCVWKFLLAKHKKTWLERGAAYMHGLLYGLLLLQPLLGIVSKLGNGKSLTLAGGISIPAILEKGAVPARLLMQIHEVIGKVLLVTIAVHIAAALFHHFILQDGVLKRMLPQMK
ncbi:MAG: cytochrome b/b6 domain-containing protein [Rickettsiales bacterium]